MADTQTAAVIGTTDSQGARASIPLLNEAGFLHVSLGACYPGFTGRFKPGEPERWYPSGGQTFARLVGDDRAQAPALVRAAGARRVVVEAEGGEDGDALAAEIRRAAAAAGVKVVAEPGRDGAVIYAGEDPLAAAERRGERRARDARHAVVLPDGRARGVEERLKGAGGPPHRARLERARAGLDARAAEFEAAFEPPSGAAPGPYAALGLAAMERCSTRSTARRPTRGRQRRRVLRVHLRRRARTVAGPLGVASRRGRDAALTAFV